MRVIPRALHGYSEYEPVRRDRECLRRPRSRWGSSTQAGRPVVLQPNHASLHDGRIIHGSEANTSTIRRCGYTMRYISTRTQFRQRKVRRLAPDLPGPRRDHAGNTYADPTIAYPEKARFREVSGKRGH